jgi:hypothetical protein
MITYDFPPACTSGIYRPVKFVKHLRNYGWEPVVLTVKNPHAVATDEIMLKDIPRGIKIYRRFSFEPTKFEQKIHKILYGTPSPIPSKNKEGQKKKSWVKRVFLSPLSSFVHNWAYIPDSKIGWFPFAFFKALNLIKKEPFDVIYTTSSPPTSQLIGLALKLFCRKPWVADFRDNWVVGYSSFYSSKRRIKLDLWLLKQILKRTDQVITMCQGNARDLIQKFKDKNQNKYQAITNGFDADDFAGLDPSSPRNPDHKLVLTHIGTLYEGTAGLFFHALKELLKEKEELKKDLEVNFIGYLSWDYQCLIQNLKLEDNVKLRGFRSHPLAIKAMLDSDVLLMFLGGLKTLRQQFPGKFFEYLYAHRTILTLGKPGEIAEVLYRSRSGILVEHDDKEKIKSTIYDLYQKKRRKKLEIYPDMDFINTYEYKNVTKVFAQVLDKTQTHIGKQT